MILNHKGRRPLKVAGLTVVAVGAAFALGVTPLAVAQTSTGQRAIFEPIAPKRILDTRDTSNPLGPAESRVLTVAPGDSGVPLGATAVVLNVTAVAPTASGFLTLYPADATRPNASNVNFVAGQTVPNAVTVKLSPYNALSCAFFGSSCRNELRIYNHAGTTHVVVDVAGYYIGHTHDDRYYTESEVNGLLPLRAVVESNGALVRGTAGAASSRSGTGTYAVTFSRDVSACAFTATVGQTGSTGIATPGMISVAGMNGNARGVVVQAAAPGGAASDRPFHLTVVC